MDYRLAGVISIILLTGIAGGTINYFLSKPEKLEWSSWLITSFVGIGASFLMPLFLRTISSNLLSDLFIEKVKYDDYLVFFGFCLLAAISSRAFIQTLSDKVLKEAKEARKEVAAVKAEIGEIESSFAPIVDSMTEQELEKSAQSEAIRAELTDLEKEILKAITSHPKFTLRSLTGITQAVNKNKTQEISREEIREGLINLVNHGYVAEVMGKTGVRWALTQSGKVLNEYGGCPQVSQKESRDLLI
ncbi:MAG: hypothetical protein NT096_09865 [Proteobacteria bacterium]|nr:hypothetical protein [Pseudomonadota bacterium]